MTTGEKIRDARKKAGLSQAELANKLGLPYQSIGQWERGVRTPKTQTIIRIAEALNVYYLDLYGDLEQNAFKEMFKLGTLAKNAIDKESLIAEYFAEGYEFTDEEARLARAFSALNNDGQAISLSFVEALVNNPRYAMYPLTDDEGGGTYGK